LPTNAAVGDHYDKVDQVVGLIALQKVIAGEILLKERFADRNAGSTLAAIVKPDMRAVTVRVDDVIGVAGFLMPGNHVDVVAARMVDQRAETRTVLRNLNVLAVDQTASQDKDQPVVVRAVTLEMSPKQAEVLVKAREEGRIQLTLRNPLDKITTSDDADIVAAAAPLKTRQALTRGGTARRWWCHHHSRHQCPQLRVDDLKRAMRTHTITRNNIMMRMPLSLRICGVIVPLLLGLGAGATVSAQEASEEGAVHAERSTSLTVPIYKSRVVTLSAAAKRISIGNPDIADVLIIGAGELYILGKDLGATNVLLWDRNDQLIAAISVVVTHDLDGLRKLLASTLPGEKIQVASAQRNIVLSGQLTSAIKMDAALQMAHGYLQQAATAKEKLMFKEETGATTSEDKKVGQIINLMTVGGAQEVMLHVKVAEVQRSAVKSLNAQFNAIHNNSSWTLGGVNGGATFPPAVFLPQNASSPISAAPNPRFLRPTEATDRSYVPCFSRCAGYRKPGPFFRFVGKNSPPN
jgi:Flp pilus assembly protein CpaB